MKKMTPKEKGQFLIEDFPKDACVEPDYKAEYERLRKELCEANRKSETLLWVLEKIKEASK